MFQQNEMSPTLVQYVKRVIRKYVKITEVLVSLALWNCSMERERIREKNESIIYRRTGRPYMNNMSIVQKVTEKK